MYNVHLAKNCKKLMVWVAKKFGEKLPLTLHVQHMSESRWEIKIYECCEPKRKRTPIAF